MDALGCAVGGLWVAFARGGDRLSLEKVIYAVANHVLDLLLLADHC